MTSRSGKVVARPCVLAVDLGTSGPKAAVVSVGGEVIANARAPVETLHLPDGGAEQDAEAVWRAVKSACREAIGRSQIAVEDLAAIICSSQYSSIVPVASDGRPTANMVLWMDKRGSKEHLSKFAAYPRRSDTPLQMLRWLRRHGLAPIGGGISLGHMRYFKYARPDVYERSAKLLEPMDYLATRLTGRPAATQCTAFMYLLTDNRRLNVTRYDDQLVAQSLIDRDKLPELVALDSVIGTVLPDVARELGILSSTKVFAGLNDTQAGGMGTAAFSGGHAAISIGSTSVMITHVGFKRTDIRHTILSMPSPVPATYFVMAENGVGGAALEYLLGNLIYAADEFGAIGANNRYDALGDAVARVPPGSDGLLFLPWMSGALAPQVEARMRGGFLNLSSKTTRAHLARAVLEGVATNLRWLKGPVESFAKRRFSHFVFYGGGAESAAWAQILADVLQAPVHQVKNPQYTTCIGLALLAFERLGMLGLHEFEQRVPIRAVYEPVAANRAVYDEMSEYFVQSFRATRPLFRALNRPGRQQS